MIILLRQKTFSAPCWTVISLQWASRSVNLCMNFIIIYENNVHMTWKTQGAGGTQSERGESRSEARLVWIISGLGHIT